MVFDVRFPEFELACLSPSVFVVFVWSEGWKEGLVQKEGFSLLSKAVLSKALTGRDKWITISKIAVPMGMCTAMTAEAVGVCILTGILELVLSSNVFKKNINQRIYAILKKCFYYLKELGGEMSNKLFLDCGGGRSKA